jgi:hypothetical protein
VSGDLHDTAPGVIWAAIPIELVTEGMEPPYPEPVEVSLEGRILQVTPSGDGTGILRRLISTDPADYLDPRWQPGSRVKLHR